MTKQQIRIGALAPLTPPGLVPAGRQLKAGIELAVEDVNQTNGSDEHRVELLFRDSAGSPDRASAALRELDAAGVVAIVGEFHSAVARPLADLALSLELPFICSSATLDELTSSRTDSVARLAPPQSHGWRVYADYLVAAGHDCVALAVTPNIYWSAGAAVLEARLREQATECISIDVTDPSGSAVVERLAEMEDMPSALLLLVDYPEPLTKIVQALRADDRFDQLLLGDPAGRAEFGEWSQLLGRDGIGVPYLRYLPTSLGEHGASVAARLSERLGEAPSFVALEGYDALMVLNECLRIAGDDRTRISAALRAVSVPGTRGQLHLSRVPDIPVLQWVWPPVQVAVHADPAHPRDATVLFEKTGSA